MKKVKKPLSQEFKLPHLFREDLEEIEKILLKDLCAKEYKLSFGDYESKRVADIPVST
jgi:hypothetical protein